MDSSRTVAQQDASRRNGAQSRGPASTEGKERSSSNRVGHGLTGQGLVLPGESIAAYRRNQVSWFEALGPTTGPEAQIVGQLADLAWRLDRCARLEHKRLAAAVENEMKQDPQWQSFSLAQRALQPINLLVHYMGSVAQSNPFTAGMRDLEHLIGAANSTVGIVRDVDEVPPDWIEALASALADLELAARAGRATPDHALAVQTEAKRIQAGLVDVLQRADEALSKLRASLASEVPGPQEADAKKLNRYRAEIEKSQARLLGILEQIRAQVQFAKAADDQESPPIRLRLRVVK